MILIPDILIMTSIGTMLMLVLKVVRVFNLRPHLRHGLSCNMLIISPFTPPYFGRPLSI